MGEHLVLRLLPLVAALVMLGGVVTASRSLRDIQATSGHIEDKTERLRELQRIRDGKTASPDAVSAFEALAAQQPPNLEVMCEKLLPGIEVDYAETIPVAAGSAWLLRQAEIAMEHAPLQQVAELIRRAESERPPWRVRECLIEADSVSAGHGRVTLTFEALHKEDI